jgi:hypothetical protein
MNNIIISNTCVGQALINKKNILPYNNPFIATLIPNDLEYIKLINNINYYIHQEPVLGNPNKESIFSKQNNNIYYVHDNIQIPYPVIYLDDIEIHCIHENDNNITLSKFKRRLDRFRELIKYNHKIITTLSFSEFINNHDDYNLVINEYFKNNKNDNLNIDKYFIGPNEYNNNNKNYIIVEEWNNINLERDKSHVLIFNNQLLSNDLFYKSIDFIEN